MSISIYCKNKIMKSEDIKEAFKILSLWGCKFEVTSSVWKQVKETRYVYAKDYDDIVTNNKTNNNLKQIDMSKITIITDKNYNYDIKIGDIITDDCHLFIVTQVADGVFTGVVLISDRFKVGTFVHDIQRNTYRKFQGTIKIE